MKFIEPKKGSISLLLLSYEGSFLFIICLPKDTNNKKNNTSTSLLEYIIFKEKAWKFSENYEYIKLINH